MDDIVGLAPTLAHVEVPMLARNLFGWFFDDSNRARPASGGVIARPRAAFGDLDGDGRVDAALTVTNGSALVLRNESSTGDSATVRLNGRSANRDAIGAVVRVLAAGGVEEDVH